MVSEEVVRLAGTEELCELVADAAGKGRLLEIRGGGSKREIGCLRRKTLVVDMRAFSGVVDYEPSELVLTVRPATPLAEIETLLASRGQMLAFEPWDHGPLFGRPAGAATIGGVLAAGVAGSRRVTAGGARDHLLGFVAVSGRGELFKGGGKVVKNVTGYDVPKVMAGSWGQLAAFTELTFKVVPRPRTAMTLVLRRLPARRAIAAMAKAIGSHCVPAAAAHMPPTAKSAAITALRLEGFRESVEYRARQLRELLAEFADAAPMDDEDADRFWTVVREARPLASADTLWRVQTTPSTAAALADTLEACGAAWLYDWAGALIWAGAPTGADIRAVAEAHGAHAMLLRAPPSLRETTPARHPEAPGLRALAARVKHAFDPAGVLDPLRFT